MAGTRVLVGREAVDWAHWGDRFYVPISQVVINGYAAYSCRLPPFIPSMQRFILDSNPLYRGARLVVYAILTLVTSADEDTNMVDPATDIDVLQAMETNFEVYCYAAAAGALSLCKAPD